ncbi:MAG: hypothetical protein AUK47_04210 [Deltaproteobacteria bacterium CG2_30_63_29]|nr:MAG: hypothetical protein AUK47_04210 [Deltaproteobacteria bacterium CG2_30_63_29]
MWVLLLIGLVWQAHATAQEGADAPPLSELLWLDHSASLLGTGVNAVVVAPDDPLRLYAAGRGYVAGSKDGGATWGPLLLLAGNEFQDEDQTLIEVHEDDLQTFEDTDAEAQFESLREEYFDEFTQRYGETLATELMLDIEDDLRDEAYADLIDQASEAGNERDYLDRLNRLLTAGFSEEEATRLASDPLAVWSLVIEVDAPKIVYAATGRGLYRSIDRGTRWERLISGLGPDGDGVLSVRAADQGKTILAGTTRGLLVSTDAGRTWSRSLGAVSSEPIREVIRVDARGRFFAMGSRGIFRTDDTGTTWTTLVPTGFDVADATAMLSPAGWGDSLFVTTPKGVHRSDDGGGTWAKLSGSGLASSGLLQVLPVDGVDKLIAITEGDVYASTDGGDNWFTASAGLVGQDLRWIAVGPTGELWLGSSSGLLKGLAGEAAAIQAESIRRLREIWAEEPSIAQVVGAGLIYHGLEDTPVDGWHEALFFSKFAPQGWVTLDYRQRRYDNEYVTWVFPNRDSDRTLDTISRQQRRTNYQNPQTNDELLGPPSNLEWQVFATWDLGRMLYDPASTTIENVGAQLRKTRQKLVGRIVRLLIKRRALQLRVVSTGELAVERHIEFQLELEEMTALLDGLTGGYYSKAASSYRAEDLLFNDDVEETARESLASIDTEGENE